VAVVATALQVAAGGAWATAALTARMAAALAARWPEARLSGTARLDWAFRLVAGPVEVGSPSAPVITVRRLRVRPRLIPLLQGRIEVALLTLDGVHVEAGARGEALARLMQERTAAGGERARAAGPSPRDLDVEVRDLTVRLPLARGARARVADLGPLSARIALRGAEGERRIAARVRLPGGGRGELALGPEPGAFHALLRGVRVADLPPGLAAVLPLRLAGGAFDLEATGARDGPRVAAEVRAAAEGLAVRWERLAPGDVGPIDVRVAGDVAWDGARLTLSGAHVAAGPRGGVEADLGAALALAREPRVEMRVEARRVDWEALVAALPPQLRPPPEAPAVRGALAGWLRASGPLRDPGAWVIEGDLDPTGLSAAPARAGALDLARPFTWRAPLPAGGTRDVEVGPARARWVPLAELPQHVTRAVLLSEDAGFYGHHGFDLREIHDALARARGGRRLRGASTITQQLAKNLFLGPERTLARKAREALATLALEASVPKRRLLEIYLNVVEWGSGVHGIGEASWHWFGKDARDLAPKEAAFLATVIPNPVRFEMYLRRGALTENAEARVRDLLVKLRAADVLSEDQFYEAWWTSLAFARG
jgi:hypothetical protein